MSETVDFDTTRNSLVPSSLTQATISAPSFSELLSISPHLPPLSHHCQPNELAVLLRRRSRNANELPAPESPIQDLLTFGSFLPLGSVRTGAVAETDEALHSVYALLRELTERGGQRRLVEGRQRRTRVARYHRGILWVRMWVVARVRVYVRRCGRPAEQGDGLHFIVMLRNDVAAYGRHPLLFRWGRGIVAEELRVDAEYERWIDGFPRAADLGRELVQRVEVLEDVVERALWYVLPLVLWAGRLADVGGRRGGWGRETNDEQHIGVLRLHARRDARIFVAGKVLCVDYGDDRVQREGTRSLALEFADLECEGGGKGRTAMRASKRVSGSVSGSGEVDAYEDSMMIRSGRNFSALQSQRGVDEGDRMLDGAPKISRSADFI